MVTIICFYRTTFFIFITPDNAACETVFSKLKAEIGPDTSYRNQEELSQAINEWIHFYNERRIQTKLGNQTPLQYEQSLIA